MTSAGRIRNRIRRWNIAVGNLATFDPVVIQFPSTRRAGVALASLAAWLSSGCAPTSASADVFRPHAPRAEGRNLGAAISSPAPPSCIPLRDASEPFLGAPYLLGGETSAGIDCSGLSRQLFRRAFGVELPRRAADQGTVGIPVFRFGLQPGDLVFFGSSADSVEHVGIYMGDGRFLSATSSGGVRYANLDETYWTTRYRFARRIPGVSGLGPSR